MNKYLTACFILINFILITNGQTILTYDMRTNKFDLVPRFFKEGEMVSIKYINLNPFLYSANTTFVDINHNYSDGSAALLTGLNSLTTAKTAGSTDAAAVAANQRVVVQQFNGRLLKPLSLQKTESENYFASKLSILDEIENDFHDIQSDVTVINGVLTLDTLIKVALLSPLLDDQAKMTAALFVPLGVYGVNSPADVNTVSVAKIGDIQSKLRHLSILVNQLFNLAGILKDTDPEKKVNSDLITGFRKQLSELQDIYSGGNLRTILNNISVLIVTANQMTAASFQLSPVSIGTAMGDQMQISDELKDRSGVTKLIIKPHRIQTYHGSRLDFSAGVGINIGGNGSEYSLRKNPNNATNGSDTGKITLYSSGKNSLLQFAPVLMVHWYRTTKRSIQWMLSGGIGPDFSSIANTKIYFGTSLGFPSSNDLTKRLVVNFGLAVGFADVLQTKYRDWNDYSRFAAIDNSALTSKAVRVGGFFAVSYNIGGTNH